MPASPMPPPPKALLLGGTPVSAGGTAGKCPIVVQSEKQFGHLTRVKRSLVNAIAIFPPGGSISPGNFHKKYNCMKILAPIIRSITLVPALLLASPLAKAQEAPKK